MTKHIHLQSAEQPLYGHLRMSPSFMLSPTWDPWSISSSHGSLSPCHNALSVGSHMPCRSWGVPGCTPVPPPTPPSRVHTSHTPSSPDIVLAYCPGTWPSGAGPWRPSWPPPGRNRSGTAGALSGPPSDGRIWINKKNNSGEAGHWKSLLSFENVLTNNAFFE